jgi:hypothetical protein
VSDGVQIDTDKVGEVGRSLRAEADTGFADAASRGTKLHGHGVEFGAGMTPSATVGEAQQRYALALANTEANLRSYRDAAGVLAAAAEEIARRFATTDMNSEQALTEVHKLIDEAISAANAATDGLVA